MASVTVRSLSKMYKIYSRPADRLKEMILRGRRIYHRKFWALQNLSFEVDRGTTLGIIGPNGSGKSTLLQLIAGTLQPSTGSVEVEGRVAALLELGSGFNPEHTGRENVYLAASILGIPREEMKERFQQIEHFAEIGEFVDQPVKTYSSGMYVRLAFAVAINLDPDILLVDEALAVGDAIFAHRCMYRVKQLQKQGVTILFVSHDVGAVTMICNRALLLNQGTLVAMGDADAVVNRYQEIITARREVYELEEDAEATSRVSVSLEEEEFPSLTYSYRHGDKACEIVAIQLLDNRGRPLQIASSGQAVRVRVVARVNQYLPNPVVGILIRNRYGIDIYGTNTHIQGHILGSCQAGDILEVNFDFPCWLTPQRYSISPAVQTVDYQSNDWVDDAFLFEVVDTFYTRGIANLHARVTTNRRSAEEVARGQ